MGTFTLKVCGGKMIRARANISNKRLSSVLITGDFFAYPEIIIEEVEKVLEGHEMNFAKIRKTVENTVKSKGATLIGINEENIAEVIIKAAEDEEQFNHK